MVHGTAIRMWTTVYRTTSTTDLLARLRRNRRLIRWNGHEKAPCARIPINLMSSSRFLHLRPLRNLRFNSDPF